MIRLAKEWTIAAVLFSAAGSAAAWSNHALGTWQALSAMPELTAAAPLTVEPLESFLAAEGAGLEKLLEQEEQWARRNVALYPPRPDALAFKSGGTPVQLRQGFLAALRLNPGSKLRLFLQTQPGADTKSKPTLPWNEVTTLQRATTAKKNIFLSLREGEQVALIDVVASATDEPDYGLDIGLWEDNGTAYGKIYGFGKQPFGNPALEFATQGPLHMGFYHESEIVYRAAGFLRRTYPEYRIHLYQTLASYALSTGHGYWGWRFAGWALHYVQDLTQPYHASVLPGVNVPRMLWINALDLMGFHTPKKQAIAIVSNRHLALENYQYSRMRDAYLRRNLNDELLRAIRDISADAGNDAYSIGSVRQVVSRRAHEAAGRTDLTLERGIPPKYISDPDYVFSETETDLDLFAILRKSPQSTPDQMTGMVAGLMQQFGTHSRGFIRSLMRRGDVR